jgi:hypothetical protein
VPKHCGDLGIGLETVEEAGVDYDLSSRSTECIDSVIFDDEHLPVNPVEMLRLRLPGLVPLVRRCVGGVCETAVSGVEDFLGEAADADAVRVRRGQDLVNTRIFKSRCLLCHTSQSQ